MNTAENALGTFIRSRRDATSPADVGLPTGNRRRAPGLRRTELAALAGISVEYLVRLEQGRDRHPSAEVVSALATALRLDPAGAEHLRNLAKISSGQCIRTCVAGTEVRPGVRAVVAAMEPAIALLAGDVGLLDPEVPNLTRYVFLDERARTAFPDWGRVADECAFHLWFGPLSERATELHDELTAHAGPDFATRIGRHDLPTAGPWRWRHPDLGELTFTRETLDLPAGDAQQLLVLLPADDATAAAVDAMRHRTGGRLRAV